MSKDVRKMVRIVQLTDTHLFASPTQTLLNLNTENTFNAVWKFILSHEKNADLFICSGDISQDETRNAYERISRAFRQTTKPVYAFPGNHDDVLLMTEAFQKAGIFQQNAVDIENWRILFVDTKVPNKIHGYLTETALTTLRSQLETSKDKHVMIFMHHHLFFPGMNAWTEKIGLLNAEDFLAVIKPFHQVKAVVSGHLHQAFSRVVQGIPFFITPSTCFQFLPGVDAFTLDDIPPGYRWFDLYPDGTFKTEVARVESVTERANLLSAQRY